MRLNRVVLLSALLANLTASANESAADPGAVLALQ